MSIMPIFRRVLLCVFLLAAGLAGSTLVAAGEATVPLAELPREARAVHALVLQGGPFRWDKDGAVFHNRERLLPRRPRGHWREYTVPTPGLGRRRGARRLVCGGELPSRPDVCHYTEDHYKSFRRITP